jgi:hypothetical protein
MFSDKSKELFSIGIILPRNLDSISAILEFASFPRTLDFLTYSVVGINMQRRMVGFKV